METIQNIKDLKLAIQQLEQMQASQYPLLKEEVMEVVESTKPINILKHTIAGLQTQPVLTTDMVNAAISFVADFVVKKVIVGKSENPLTTLVETVIQIGVANVLHTNNDNMQVFTHHVVNLISLEPKKIANNA